MRRKGRAGFDFRSMHYLIHARGTVVLLLECRNARGENGCRERKAETSRWTDLMMAVGGEVSIRRLLCLMETSSD